MTKTFEEYVDEWDALCKEIAKLKKKLKPLVEAEMTMRRAIADSVKTVMGADWKEGMNTFNMVDARKLKINNKIDRKIEEGEVANARAAYEAAQPNIPFDSLLRVKHELEIKEFRKLSTGSPAALAVSRMVVTKAAAPEVEIQ